MPDKHALSGDEERSAETIVRVSRPRLDTSETALTVRAQALSDTDTAAAVKDERETTGTANTDYIVSEQEYSNDDDDDDDDDGVQMMFTIPRSIGIMASTIKKEEEKVNEECDDNYDNDDDNYDNDKDNDYNGNINVTMESTKPARKGMKRFPMKCSFPGCNFIIKRSQTKSDHGRNHKTEVQVCCSGKMVMFKRESLDVPWGCPFDNCSKVPVKCLKTLIQHVSANHIIKNRSRYSDDGDDDDDDDSNSNNDNGVPNSLQSQQQWEEEEVKLLVVEQQTESLTIAANLSDDSDSDDSDSDNDSDSDGSGVPGISGRTELAMTYGGVIRLFDVGGVECGYHVKTGAFVCFDCRLVPEILTEHLRDYHSVSQYVIQSVQLPPVAINARRDPSSNQHTGNPNLAFTIGSNVEELASSGHDDVVAGLSCSEPNCVYSSKALNNLRQHWYSKHDRERSQYTPAVTLRYPYSISGYAYLMVCRYDIATALGRNAAQPRIYKKRSKTMANSVRTQSLRSAAKLNTPVTAEEIKPTIPRLLLPRLLPYLGDPLLFTQRDGSELHFSNVCSAVNSLLRDSNALLQQLMHGYIRSPALQLSDATASDLSVPQQKSSNNMSAACDDELQKLYSHLEQAAPHLHSAIKGNVPADANAPDVIAFVIAHNQLMQMLVLLIVIVGSVPLMSASELASLCLCGTGSEDRNMYLHGGCIVLFPHCTAPDGSTHITVRALPRVVSQLLVDFLVFVRRPWIEIERHRGNGLLVEQLSTMFIPYFDRNMYSESPSASSASSVSSTSSSSLTFGTLTQKYFGCALTLEAFRDVCIYWAKHFGVEENQSTLYQDHHQHYQMSSYSLAVGFQASHQWQDLLTKYGATCLK